MSDDGVAQAFSPKLVSRLRDVSRSGPEERKSVVREKPMTSASCTWPSSQAATARSATASDTLRKWWDGDSDYDASFKHVLGLPRAGRKVYAKALNETLGQVAMVVPKLASAPAAGHRMLTDILREGRDVEIALSTALEDGHLDPTEKGLIRTEALELIAKLGALVSCCEQGDSRPPLHAVDPKTNRA